MRVRARHPPTFTPRPTSSSFLSFEFREVLVRVGVKVRGGEGGARRFQFLLAMFGDRVVLLEDTAPSVRPFGPLAIGGIPLYLSRGGPPKHSSFGPEGTSLDA